MPLILAIEPDRRQAAQLRSVIGRRLRAELVLADTTERALDAIGVRVPDLILVPTLLSPQDDAALAGALRVIAAASRVEILTIPVLAPPATTEHGKAGVLSMLWRGKQQSASPEGCDPDVFIEQIASYLERQIADRCERLDDEAMPAAEVEAPAPPVDVAPDVAHLEGDDVGAEIDLSEVLASVAAEEALDAAELADLVAASRTPEADSEMWMPLPTATSAGWPPLDSKVMERTPEPSWLDPEPPAPAAPPEPLRAAPAPVAPAPPKPAQAPTAEWTELLESLRLDIERLRKQTPAAAAQTPATRRDAPPRPAQDEWGFFDPEQCGFTALLAKLNEVTKESDALL